MFVIALVGLGSKLFLNLGCSQVDVHGLPTLLDAFEQGRKEGRGVITVSNHISVLDDPLIWGILPTKYFLSPSTMRWTLGASDIIFTNSAFSSFFRWGQVLETFRGSGIYQTAIDTAIRQLDRGSWVHVFPEGKVNQAKHRDPPGDLIRFKWGVGHMMMRAIKPPIVVPMWISGFDEIMHEDRTFPRFFPRLGRKVSITFGDPEGITKETSAILSQWRSGGPHDQEWIQRSRRLESMERDGSLATTPGKVGPARDLVVGPHGLQSLERPETTEARAQLTAVLQRAVKRLGEAVEARHGTSTQV